MKADVVEAKAQRRIELIKEKIQHRFPEARFQLTKFGDEKAKFILSVHLLAADLDEFDEFDVLDLVKEDLAEASLQDGITIYVVPWTGAWVA